MNGTNKVLVANSGPVNVGPPLIRTSQLRLSLTHIKVSTPDPPALMENPENRQDIRYVFFVISYDDAVG